ncbi:MAG: hypothetical protein FWG27_01435 [Treponema sp.]|nr:hypothetical protein [Treponema sp.]
MNGKNNHSRRRHFRRNSQENAGQDSRNTPESKGRGDFQHTSPLSGANGRQNRVGRPGSVEGLETRTESQNQRLGQDRPPYKTDGPLRLKKQERFTPSSKNGSPHERPRWIAPKLNNDPLPVLNCCRCGHSIADSHTALKDKHTGEPVHFDCVMTELAEQEILETGDSLSYIGGGRFGIVHFNNGKGESRNFTIKKIFEWEDKEKKAEWRGAIADHYSIT